MLEEYDKIDTVVISKEGKIELVIMDAGITEDPKERKQHLLKKLKAYLYYILKGDFEKEHPQKTINDIRIRVMCKLPPTEEMKQMSAVHNPENPEDFVELVFQHFPGADDAQPATVTAVPGQPTKKKRSFRSWFAGRGLALGIGGILLLIATFFGFSFGGHSFSAYDTQITAAALAFIGFTVFFLCRERKR